MIKIKDKVNVWIQSLELSKKEMHQIIIIIIVTILLSLGLLWVDSQPLEDTLLRNTYGEGSKQEVLEVEFESETKEGFTEERIDISIDIGELEYTSDEITSVFETCLLELDQIILGENESADCIYYNLNLVDTLENGSIEVTWNWSPYDLLNLDGEIQQAYVEEKGSILELEATLSYGDMEILYSQSVCIYPELKDEKVLQVEQLLNMLSELEENTKSDTELSLPKELEGISLTWYQKQSYRWLAIVMMGGATILLLLWKKEDSKNKENIMRREQMIRDYPQIINTFALYIGAGMTVKNIWKKMVMEYEDKEDRAEKRYAYEEMKTTYFEMINGVSEIECYEQFAKRCEIRSYQRFGLLLNQNIRKGTKGLTVLLGREASEAFENRKNRARQEGEKVGTKLLMPMLLMLAVVLVIIIVPAFCSIQI